MNTDSNDEWTNQLKRHRLYSSLSTLAPTLVLLAVAFAIGLNQEAIGHLCIFSLATTSVGFCLSATQQAVGRIRTAVALSLRAEADSAWVEKIGREITRASMYKFWTFWTIVSWVCVVVTDLRFRLDVQDGQATQHYNYWLATPCAAICAKLAWNKVRDISQLRPVGLSEGEVSADELLGLKYQTR